jgi:hypothetical protein
LGPCSLSAAWFAQPFAPKPACRVRKQGCRLTNL